MLFTCSFFPERLLSELRTFRLRPVWGYLRGGFGTLNTPGWSILWWQLVIDCYLRGFLLGCLAGWWMLLCGLILFLRCHNGVRKYILCFHLVFMLLICYLHCYYTIQMHVEFNSMDQPHAFYRSTQRRI